LSQEKRIVCRDERRGEFLTGTDRMPEQLTVSPSPHISKPLTTQRIMLDVVIALLPATLAGIVFFRSYAVVLIASCVITALAAEWICMKMLGRENSLGDMSAIVTALILALSLPPTLPWWAAVIGTAFAIVIGKMVFGGLGANVFNPAMVGRAFLTLSFGMMMTTWTVPATVDADMPEIELGGETVNAITQATPLSLSKDAIRGDIEADVVNNLLWPSFIGGVGGCVGETSTLMLLLGAVYLIWRKTIDLRIPAGILAAAFVIGAIAYLINPDSYISPVVHLTTGAMIFGAFFIATDPVTAPLTPRGMWVFGAGVGALTMVIRILGVYPEGIMLAVLFMNAMTPLLDGVFKWVPLGGAPDAK